MRADSSAQSAADAPADRALEGAHPCDLTTQGPSPSANQGIRQGWGKSSDVLDQWPEAAESPAGDRAELSSGADWLSGDRCFSSAKERTTSSAFGRRADPSRDVSWDADRSCRRRGAASDG